MAWDHLSIDKPHLVYLILGGFTTLFMLCSSVIKERLYIGEATVATICGVIFGPHAANLIDPNTWGNTDQITIEFSRIVLVVQCFAVGVELPRAYMERHWRSVVFLLIPVMTFGWLITSLFIWGLFHTRLDWLDSLIIAACVTATDPVLASSVVGKGKFAKRVPKHLRDLLSAESGCNDGMAFPFVYLAIYISHYKGSPNEVALNWFCVTILYECIFGAIYGVTIGYIARKAVRYAHERDLIDRESFLVFYFVLALFCAGSGSLLGMDDLLIGFACGVGFSNDGWFLEKTEESHVSNVIDLLINLAFFVYLGTIIPWAQYNDAVLGINPWKLVVLALLVLFFRRIPIMMLLKPMIPDIKTWREALFAGHFGPIGVGAIFVAILARSEMEGNDTTPLATLPPFDAEHANVVYLVWPIVTFLVLASILVHGSSIAVFTLGKRINTLTITMSYTQAGEDGNWMDRLPRIQSRSKTSGSRARSDASGSDVDEEKMPDYPAATLPKNFLRRQKEGETPTHSRGNSRDRKRRSRRWSGGPVEESAIRPRPRQQDSDSSTLQQEQSPSDTFALHSESSSAARDGDEPDKHAGSKKKKGKKHDDEEREIETFQEGGDTVFEDEEGNVLEVMTSREGETDEDRQHHVEEEAKNLMSDEEVEHGVSKKEQGIQSGLHMDEIEHNIKDHDMKGQEGNELENHGHAPESSGENGKTGMLEHEAQRLKGMGKRMMSGLHMKRDPDMHPEKEGQPPKAEKTHPHRSNRGPARAYRFGRTIIVEDEDGEVIKKYDIPAPEKPQRTTQNHANPGNTRQRLTRMGTLLGINKDEAADAAENGTQNVDVEKPRVDKQKKMKPEDDNDDDVRFTVGGNARRMNRADFIRQISEFDPKTRAKVVEQSNAPKKVKEAAREDEREHSDNKRKASVQSMHNQDVQSRKEDGDNGRVKKIDGNDHRTGPEGLALVDSKNEHIPLHNEPRKGSGSGPSKSGGGNSETAAQRRRRQAARTSTAGSGYFSSHAPQSTRPYNSIDEETAGETPKPQSQSPPTSHQQSRPAPADDSDDDGTERIPPPRTQSHHVSHSDTHSSSSSNRPNLHSQPSNAPETSAERRRREQALGTSKEDSDSDEDAPSASSRPSNARRSVRAATSRRDEDIAEEDEDEEEVVQADEPPRGRQTGIRFMDPTPRQRMERQGHDRDRETQRQADAEAQGQGQSAANNDGNANVGLGTRLKWAVGLGKKK